MRFTMRSVRFFAPHAALFVLFLIGSWMALFLLLCCFLAQFVLTIYSMRVPIYDKITIETFSGSHFAEKGRWVLDKLGVDYLEETDLAVIGIFSTGRSIPTLHVPVERSGRSHTISNSAQIAPFLYGLYCHSHECDWLKPSAEARKLEKEFDRMGVAVQRHGYYHLLNLEDMSVLKTLWGFNDPNVPLWQKAVGHAAFPVLTKIMSKVFKSGTKATHANSFNLIKDTFELVDNRLKEQKSQYLLGDEFHYVDLVFCSLASIPLHPDPREDDGWNFTNRRGVNSRPDVVSYGFSKDAKELRIMFPSVVAYIQRVYKTHRTPSKIQ